MHIAAAVGTPLVALFSHMSPRDCGPYVPAGNYTALRAEDTGHPELGLAAISPESVFSACLPFPFFLSNALCKWERWPGIKGEAWVTPQRHSAAGGRNQTGRFSPRAGRAERSAFSYQPSAGGISNNGCAAP
jgi:hypothetical protein